MSSSITKGSVHEGKVWFHLAENGHSFQLDCDETTPVEAVMRYIESVTGISFNEQLLLCSSSRLEPNSLLSAYGIPSTDKEVFIFSKSRLQHTSPPPASEQIDVLEIADPPPPGCLHEAHPLDDALDPALKALPSYERQFRYHYHKGHAIYNRTLDHYAHCERFLREQKVQERAVDIARVHLEPYFRMLTLNYSDFMKHYMRQHRIHSDLLVNYRRDLEKLSSIKLHPDLQSSSHNCLLDFVDQKKLKTAVQICSNSHKQFERKVTEFRQMFDETKCKAEELLACRVSFSITIKNLELTIKENQNFITEQKSIMQSLSQDVNKVKELVDNCLSSQLSSSLRPHDAVSALGPMYDVHDKSHLPKMEACGRSITKLLEFCKEKKNDMNIFVHKFMQKITHVNYLIKDAKFQFPVFREALKRQEDLFSDLRYVHGIGPSYRACLAEVVRRRASMKLYMGMAGQLAERLATKRDAEVRRREEFRKVHSFYMPSDILEKMGLYCTPSQCDVNIAPFDTNLLHIDISDLDRYAPEHLAGLLSKSEKHANLRGSFSMSHDNSLSAEAEEIVVDSLDKDDSELLEGCDLVEIAGTSKMEVENAKLKAELASAKALICSLSLEAEYEAVADGEVDSLLQKAAAKTAEALHLKDEYGKHLQSMLKEKQQQCLSYEKRIQELEQRLSDQYLQGQKLSSSTVISEFDIPALKTDDCEPQTQGERAIHMPDVSTSEPMDAVSCISNSLDAKLGLFTRHPSKGREAVDENMLDSSGMLNTQLDSLMMERQPEELPFSEKESKDKPVTQLGMSLANSSTAESMPEAQNILPSDTAVETKTSDVLLELQRALEEKSNQLTEMENKLEASMKLLEESQMNCAHLENCLHEAREEAQTHLCAADRRASEYSALRGSAVKMRGLFERLKSCVYAPVGVDGFADSLRALAQSLGNSISENEDDGTTEFRKCIRALSKKVSFLSRHREELLDEKSKLEAATEQLRKELEEKKELVTTLYKKHQLEKQANKERISFNRLEIHEIAAFVLNAAGHYEAINRNSSNYYLSTESVALFTDHLPSRPRYIVGQIVHIERQMVKPLPPTPARLEQGRANPADHLTSDSSTDRLTLNPGSTSNPYNLSTGCEYFVVTVAMLPDTSIRSSTS